MLLRGLLVDGLVEGVHFACPSSHHPLPPGFLLFLPLALLLRPVLVLIPHFPELLTHSNVDLHLGEAVELRVRVAAVGAVVLVVGVLRIAVQLARIYEVVLVLEGELGRLGALEELGLVLGLLGDAQAHLPLPLGLLLPGHGLLRIAPLLPATLLDLLRKLLLQLLVRGLVLVVLVVVLLRLLLLLLVAVLVEKLRDGIIDVFG
mmetsp:Transcript_101038/g.253366  ORF Transcript_101038/g.253366 Transcript_101038/m.253366 type:complete len:204 (-) Transcript_101038:1201-1812(-)